MASSTSASSSSSSSFRIFHGLKTLSTKEYLILFLFFLVFLYLTKVYSSEPSKIVLVIPQPPDNHTDNNITGMIFPNFQKQQGDALDHGLFFKNQEQGNGGLEEDGCDIFEGRWVEDDLGPSYEPGSCPLIDDGFNCAKAGRPDLNYTKWRWQPKGCNLPRIEGKKMLEMLRGKKVAFVGDSINRNMWESLVCILRNSLQNTSRVYEVSGRKEFKSDKHYSFRFIDYNCTIDFFWSTFLVQEQKMLGPNGTEKETLKLDTVDDCFREYEDSDVIIFNTGHWWTHTKTSKGKDYYQEGDHVYDQLSAEEALEKAMRTWVRWVETHTDLNRTRIFFRGYSSSHFGGGKWSEGGNCIGETLPVAIEEQLVRAPKLVEVVESVITEMKSPVVYLNVTRMTDYRKDGHPSKYRPGAESTKLDCSHWCLPGVPDVWNDMVWTMLMKRG